eukprot:3954470-Amphidinium_carterae.3
MDIWSSALADGKKLGLLSSGTACRAEKESRVLLSVPLDVLHASTSKQPKQEPKHHKLRTVLAI